MAEYVSREDILDIASQYCTDDDGSCSKADVDIKEMLDEIEALPAADVQLVKHGRWIGIYEYCEKNGYVPSGMGIYYWCSECDKAEQKTSDFCPHCGARMDGDTNG